MTHEYSNNWFEQTAKVSWDNLIPAIRPQKILEIGSYEGRSICYLIDQLGHELDLEIHAIDTWEGGEDHKNANINMSSVEERFKNNIKKSIEQATKKIDLSIHKGFSDIELSRLLSNGFQNYFDFIYVDGSHETADVLSDAVLAFKLLKPRGIMAFDDYLWHELTDQHYLKNSPKLAIDAFININFSKVNIIHSLNSQVYIAKK